VNGMGHECLPEWLDLDRRLPGLQQLPISGSGLLSSLWIAAF
jgi:hypothetical protein